MTSNQSFFYNLKTLPVDRFFSNVLYDKRFGYYSSKNPFGNKGDFLTSPGVSNIFSEIIGIWLISTWTSMGKPKIFNVVELGPGDGNLTKILIKIFKKFPEFDNAVNIFLYEKNNYLKKIQKKNIDDTKIKWINNFKKIRKGPVIFFGNEFFDAIPIKQFYRKGKLLLEKHYSINKKDQIIEVSKKVSQKEILKIKRFKTLKNLTFIEFPKLGFKELNKIIKKISSLNGGILLIDYGYIKPNNSNTMQSVMRHKKNNLLDNLGKADITSLVNFKLLDEFFKKKNLKVKKIVTQKFFLEKMGIMERSNNLSKNMSFKEQVNLYSRIKRLIDVKLMGELFKVVFAYKFKKNNFPGFK